MAKILRDLLDAEEPLFSLGIQQLERASGDVGEDARLVGEISEKIAGLLRSLRLDPHETTGSELYHALIARVADDNVRIAKRIGGTDPDDVNEMVPLMVAAVEKMSINRKVWVLKHSVAKELLKKMPPKKLMAHLGYRSIDSMLKHEDIDEIYTALRFSEGSEWLNTYNELFKTVRASDFETRDIRIVVMNHAKYVDLAAQFVERKLHNITHTKELGVIAVVPMHHRRMKGIVLKSLPLLFHYINEIRLYSSFFKLNQVKAHFGEVVVQTLIADPAGASQMAGHHVHWRVIQRYFGKLKDEAHPEALEPHVHPEDLHWRRAEELLTELDPHMVFWCGLDYVARLYDGAPVTANLMDVSLSYSNEVSYQHRYVYHFRESLWNEIFMRYMGKKNLETQILQQLDNNMIAPEKLPLPIRTKSEREADKARRSHVLMRQKMIDAAEGRLIGVAEEFARAFDILQKYEKVVTIFGSARTPENTPEYQNAYELASRLVAQGYAVMTGGGNGTMAAANRGASESGGDSLGFNITLPTEQHLNPYVTENYQFEHFFGRKVAMTLQMSAYIYCPGGFGTLDELFEIVTLEQTGKIPRVPIILFGTKFWNPMMKYVEKVFLKEYKTIAAADLKLFTITDDIDEIVQTVVKHERDKYQDPKGAVPGAPKAKAKNK